MFAYEERAGGGSNGLCSLGSVMMDTCSYTHIDVQEVDLSVTTATPDLGFVVHHVKNGSAGMILKRRRLIMRLKELLRGGMLKH